MGTRREDELSEELAEHIRCGNTDMIFDPAYRSVVDMVYNNGPSLRELAENNEVNDLNGRSDRFHDR